MDVKFFHVNETEAAIDGKLYFIQQNPVVAIPYLVVICLATMSGTIGNILVIGAVLANKHLKKVGNMFIANLAIADFCVSSFVNPFSIVGIIEGEQWFRTRPVICEAVASICLTSCFCSLLNIGSISFNRYVHIVHHEHYARIYSVRNTILMCIGLWVISFLMGMPNFIGWGDHVYDKKTLSCVWDRTADFSYTLFAAVVGVTFPVLLISGCYLKIYLHVIRQKRKVSSMSDQSKSMSMRARQESMKLARMLFIIFMIFVACWTPYAIIILADVDDNYPQEIHSFSILLAHINSSLNSILYGLSDKNFRNGYKYLLGISWCQEKLNHRANVDANDNKTNDVTEYEMSNNEGKSRNHLVMRM